MSSTGAVAGNGNSGALNYNGPGNENDWEPALSADGRYVAFQSNASNLTTTDTNDTTDVFVYDRQQHQITRVSVSSDGVEANGASYRPELSPDGRYVVFASDADNLVAGDTDGATDTFVYDLQAHTIQRVSQRPDFTGGDNSSAWGDASSAYFVAFGSEATNLADNNLDGFVDLDSNNASDIIVSDRFGGARGLVMEEAGGPGDFDHERKTRVHGFRPQHRGSGAGGGDWGALTAQVTTDTDNGIRGHRHLELPGRGVDGAASVVRRASRRRLHGDAQRWGR